MGALEPSINAVVTGALINFKWIKRTQSVAM